jgi:hypothetical protein
VAGAPPAASDVAEAESIDMYVRLAGATNGSSCSPPKKAQKIS